MTLTQEDKLRIRKFVDDKVMELIMKGDRLTEYYWIEMKLRKRDKMDKRGCKCQFKELRRNVQSLINQYHSVIYTDGDSEI